MCPPPHTGYETIAQLRICQIRSARISSRSGPRTQQRRRSRPQTPGATRDTAPCTLISHTEVHELNHAVHTQTTVTYHALRRFLKKNWKKGQVVGFRCGAKRHLPRHRPLTIFFSFFCILLLRLCVLLLIYEAPPSDNFLFFFLYPLAHIMCPPPHIRGTALWQFSGGKKLKLNTDQFSDSDAEQSPTPSW
jgi:hypothetical protein